MNPVYVTKTFLPPLDEFVDMLRDEIWKTHQVTNFGPLYRQFVQALREKTNIDHLVCLANGTLALQIAIRALDLNGGEVVTTPFTYVATSDCLIWEGCKPVYVDIDPNTLNIDPEKIEEKITEKTKGILGVHVYSNPCDVETIVSIAKKYGLSVIFDAAHAFGVSYMGRSLFSYGDVSMASFNATKSFHTMEGGALFCRSEEMAKSVKKLANFGMDEDKKISQQYGTNAKLTEMCSAMGLVNLRYLDLATQQRKEAYELYCTLLESKKQIRLQKLSGEINYSYMPIVLSSEKYKFRLLNKLHEHKIYPREYFYPSLETVFSDKIECQISLDISRRVLCLPMSNYLTTDEIERICSIINSVTS